MTLETKSMKLSLNPGQTVTILTWYDTISEESASNGAYDSTGNDMHRCFCSNLVEAAIEIASWTLNNAYDYGDILDDTLTSIDADTDLDSVHMSEDQRQLAYDNFRQRNLICVTPQEELT